MKCLKFIDKPYVKEYVATEAKIIVWRTDFPQPYGGNKQGYNNPVTKPHLQKSLYAYACGRLRAIQLANGEGRIDDEKGPGGWDGAEVHKNESRQQTILWIPGNAILFVPNDSLATYGRKQWPTTKGIGTISITRKDALRHPEIVASSYEHVGDVPFVENYRHIFLAEPRRVKLVDGEFIEEQGITAASAKAKLGVSDLWLVDTGCGHDLVSTANAKLSKGTSKYLDSPVTFQTANGDAPSTHSSQIFIEELNEMIEPYILTDTPSVISVGDRAMNKGYSFVWISGRKPYWITPEGKIITLEVIRDIPYLRRNSDFCKPRDAIANDYIIPKHMGLPSVKDDSHVFNDEEIRPPDAVTSTINAEPLPHDIPSDEHDGDVVGEDDEVTTRNLRQEAMSLRHLLTHKPANKYCDACILGKMRGAKKFCGSYERSRQPTKWLELVTADHLVAQNGSMEGITGDCDAIVIKDLFSKVKALFPVFNKTGEEAERVFRHFFGNTKVEIFYSDNAPELVLACKNLGIVHELSLPGVPQNNSIVERTNLDILEGTRTCLVCAGFPQCFWPFAAPHFCFLDNTSCYGSDGKLLEEGSHYARAHGKGEPKVLRLPFGCEVIFVPQDTKKLIHGKWEGSGEIGVIAGYGLNAGYHWNGEYLCWSLKELARIDMHEHVAKYPYSLRSPHRTRRVFFAP